MKRSPELTPLSHEHHQSLRLAKNCLNTAASGDENKCKALCQHIVDIFDDEWERHFRNEESSIFDITASMDGEIHQLGIRLVEEHNRMRTMAKDMMHGGDCEILAAFGALLRDHTRLEERELFPLVETRFSQEQLDAIRELTASRLHGDIHGHSEQDFLNEA